VIGSATSSAYHQLGTVASEWRISDDAKYSYSARQVAAANLATVALVDWPNGSHDARLAGDEYLPLALRLWAGGRLCREGRKQFQRLCLAQSVDVYLEVG
jgi:hypothetical protein